MLINEVRCDMTEEKILTCINCPMGCLLTVTLENGEVKSVSGNTCPRGDTYGRTECTAPVRVVTGLVRVANGKEPLSVKTAQAIPKSSVADCIALLGKTVVNAPVAAGDVVIENVCGSGVNVIATKSVK